MNVDTGIFLEALGHGATSFTFQTFDDQKKNRPEAEREIWSKKLRRVLHGTLATHQKQLEALNSSDAGVFVTVNETDGRGRKEQNIVRVRALFVDLDGAPLQPVIDGPVAPHIIVESSPGRWHAYWLVKDCMLEQFGPAQKGLMGRFSSDESVFDLPRVMRLPGFAHRKGEHYVTRLAELNEAAPYDFAWFAAAMELTHYADVLHQRQEERRQAAKASRGEPQQAKPRAEPAERDDKLRDQIDDLRDALRSIAVDDGDRANWIKLGHCLKELGEQGYSLWLEWSSKSQYFNEAGARETWNSFHPKDSGIKGIFAEAKKHGWDPRQSPSVKRRRAKRKAEGRPSKPRLTPPHPQHSPPDAAAPPPDEPDEAAPDIDTLDPTDFSNAALHERYVLIYGTVTVFDRLHRRVLSLESLRAAATKSAVNRWLGSDNRCIVAQDQVLFAPHLPNLPAPSINLFRGIRMKPRRGDTSKIMELLHHLCGESDNLMEWVLRWTAFPLQHVGAKMQTMIVMHGPQGAGKNIFWGAIKKIYGEYGIIITQTQLEGKFNGWASAKLFVIGNELVPRAELWASKGLINNMVTEDEWQIEEKHLPSRTEANRANFVLLSNSLQPIITDPDDRRANVIWTPKPKPEAFYAALNNELKNGGVEALYDALLAVDLGDFAEHTKPPVTDAKLDLIELSMDTPERFWRQWSDGRLRHPYVPALTMDVYRAYRLWAERRGEKPLREVQFVAHLSKRMRKALEYFVIGAGEKKRQNMFTPEDWKPSGQKSEATQRGESIGFFRESFGEGANA